MNTTIKNQDELNKISLDYYGDIIIDGGDTNKPIVIDIYYKNANIFLVNSSIVVLKGSSQVSKNITSSCRVGLHISDLLFAVNFGKSWEDLAILLIEVDINDVIVSVDCDGKVRTSKLKVIRELDISEYQDFFVKSTCIYQKQILSLSHKILAKEVPIKTETFNFLILPAKFQIQIIIYEIN